jgi:hypothetical protein
VHIDRRFGFHLVRAVLCASALTLSGCTATTTVRASRASEGIAGEGTAAGGGVPSAPPISIDECGTPNPAGLSAADAQQLRAAATPGTLKLLSPSEGTVFPRGNLAPDLRWSGAEADAVYVHIKSTAFEYTGCLKPTAAGQLTLAQNVWDEASMRTYGTEEVFTLELATWSKGIIAGLVTLHFQIA